MGILICGLNGSGKSTLGKVLADRIGYEFIDNEDLYFPKTDAGYIFSAPRSKEEAVRLLEDEERLESMRAALAALSAPEAAENLCSFVETLDKAPEHG